MSCAGTAASMDAGACVGVAAGGCLCAGGKRPVLYSAAKSLELDLMALPGAVHLPLDDKLKVVRLALVSQERVSAPKGAPYLVGNDVEKDSLRLDVREATDAETQRRVQMHIHGKITSPCTTWIERVDVEEDLAAHGIAAAARRRQESQFKDQA